MANLKYNGWKRVDSSDADAGLDVVTSGKRVLTFGDNGSTDSLTEGNRPSALILGAGTSSGRVTTSTANTKFISFYFDSSAASGSAEGLYIRQYATGAMGTAQALRAFTTVQDVAVSSAARGIHASLSFGSTGSVTGEGEAVEATLHVPSTAGMSGTVSAIKAAINSDASTSDPVGARISFIRIVNQGDTTGGADVDDDAACLDFSGFTIGSGNMIESSTTEANYAYSVRCKLPDGTPAYLMLASAAG